MNLADAVDSHQALVQKAIHWLYGSRHCNMVLSGAASCSEIPDAIGWSTRSKQYGSLVVECKTSLPDFHADKKKYLRWRHQVHGWEYSASRFGVKEAEREGYTAVEISAMGRWRYFLAPEGLLTPELIEQHRPDHGLLVPGARGGLRVLREAPERPNPALEEEIRMLQFALVHASENLQQAGVLLNWPRLLMFHRSNDQAMLRHTLELEFTESQE